MSEQFHFESGQFYLDKGDYEASIKHFEKLLNTAIGQNRMLGLFLLAEGHRLNSNFTTAVICYEDVLRIPEDNIDPSVAARLKNGARQNIEHCLKLKTIPCPLNYLFRPKRLLIEPVNICNYSCYKCLYSKMKREKVQLDPRKYRTFLENWVRRCGAFEEIIFTGGGEALLHKQLEEIVIITKKFMPNTKLTVGSNLALLTEKRAKELIAAGLNNWEVSFDTDDKDEHFSLTGKDTFDLVLKNIKILWNALADGRIGTIEIATHRVFDKDYLIKINAIEEMVKGFYSTFRHAPYTTLMRRNLHPGLELFENTINYNDPCPVICLEPWENLVVTSDGGVRRCCSDMFDCPDNETLGNVFIQDVDETIRNSKRHELQKRLAEHDLHSLYLCSKCYSLYQHTSSVNAGIKKSD